MVMVERDKYLWKVPTLISDIEFGMTIDSRLKQQTKTSHPIFVIESGRLIDSRDEQR